MGGMTHRPPTPRSKLQTRKPAMSRADAAWSRLSAAKLADEALRTSGVTASDHSSGSGSSGAGGDLRSSSPPLISSSAAASGEALTRFRAYCKQYVPVPGLVR